MMLAPNANGIWSKEDEELVRYAIQSAPPGSVLSVDLEVPLSIVKQVVRQSEECGMPIVLDPSPAERLDEELLEADCYLTPNQSEAQRLTNIPIDTHDQALEAAKRLMKHGKRSLRKTGNRGMRDSHKGRSVCHLRSRGRGGGYHRSGRCICGSIQCGDSGTSTP